LGNDSRRFLLAFVISIAVMFLWSSFFAPKPPKPTAKAPAPQGAPAPAQGGKPAEPSPATAAGLPTQAAPAPEAAEETVVLSGNGFSATFSTWGGALKSLSLQGEKFRRKEGNESVPIDLVRIAEGQPYPLSHVFTPEGGKAEEAMATSRAAMSIAAKDDRSVTFVGKVGGADVRKTYRLTGKPFEISLALDVSAGQQAGTLTLLYPTFMPPNTSSGGFFSGPALDYVRPICRGGQTTERYDPKEGKAPTKVEGPAGWAGADQHYFISAFFPAEPEGTCVLASGAVKGSGFAAIALPFGGARKAEFTVYAGPKDLDTLRGYGRSFDTAIDYGSVAKFFALFARGLLYVMRWLQLFVRNWGVAIILLTLLVRLVLFPLTYKSMQSMNEMRKLQPEIEKLKAKYGSDREKMNMAVMQLYQQHKVNPLGGCLPMLLQMPIWFALYAALQTSVELYREQFLWIQDLTVKDPYYILPLAMGVSSFLMQKLSPQPADNTQAKMMLYFFPIFFTFIMINVPAGLTLYIFVNNLLSIIQQQVMMKKQTAVVAPAK
jgi:YidC/Oxa1 family membrane protein insertase